jgi:hypothetical protein
VRLRTGPLDRSPASAGSAEAFPNTSKPPGANSYPIAHRLTILFPLPSDAIKAQKNAERRLSQAIPVYAAPDQDVCGVDT